MLSVIIPTKNEARYLPRLLHSLEAQTRVPDEVIVADAQSADETRSIARAFGARVVDGGLPSRGRNAGAAAASGDVLLFLDADVVLENPRFLEESLTQMQARGFDITTCDVSPLTDRRVDRFLHGFYNKYVRAWGARLPHAPGFCIFVRADLHARIGGFDEAIQFCEDHDYARRAGKCGAFGFLSTRIPVSVRRLRRDGRANIAVKFALAELHLLALGPIRHKKFRYTFGHKQ